MIRLALVLCDPEGEPSAAQLAVEIYRDPVAPGRWVAGNVGRPRQVVTVRRRGDHRSAGVAVFERLALVDGDALMMRENAPAPRTQQVPLRIDRER